jgi:hypothetical protein
MIIDQIHDVFGCFINETMIEPNALILSPKAYDILKEYMLNMWIGEDIEKVFGMEVYVINNCKPDDIIVKVGYIR